MERDLEFVPGRNFVLQVAGIYHQDEVVILLYLIACGYQFEVSCKRFIGRDGVPGKWAMSDQATAAFPVALEKGEKGTDLLDKGTDLFDGRCRPTGPTVLDPSANNALNLINKARVAGQLPALQ
jgi:hypothetical protein